MLLSLIVFALFETFGISDAAGRIVCYYGSWSVYRPGNGQFDIEDINPSLCTHLIYSFVGINADGSIRILDKGQDIDKGGFKKFNALKSKNRNLKTLVAIGGWNEKSEVFSQVARTASLRTAFANNALSFIKTHGFDGFDLDWEYPAQRGGIAADKQNFVLMVKELKRIFAPSKHLLTAAVGATASIIAASYDVPSLSRELDFINVMTYDLHGPTDGVTGQNAPLYAAPHETTPEQKQLNVDACIKAWIQKGAARAKLTLGVGVYGHSFTLNNPNNNGLGAPASQPGRAGPYTNQPGTLGYNEICEMHKKDTWTVVWSNPQRVPYTYRGNQWVGYDNPRSVKIKVDYAKTMKLGGIMTWSIDTDDFKGICGAKYPILSTIKNNL